MTPYRTTYTTQNMGNTIWFGVSNEPNCPPMDFRLHPRYIKEFLKHALW